MRYVFLSGLASLVVAASLVGCFSRGEETPKNEAVDIVTNPKPPRRGAAKEFFEVVDTIRLSNEVLVGRIDFLDVSPSGQHYLITDSRAREVWIFNADGDFIRKLTPENCHPGFNMRPIRARYFDGTETIIMTNSGPWGYRFKANGSCLGPVPEDFTPPRQMAFDGAGKMYGFYPRSSIIKVMTSSGKVVEEFEPVETDYPVFTGRVVRYPNIIFAESYIYHASVVSPRINVYSPEGEHVGTFRHLPKYYTPPEQRISKNVGAQRAAMLAGQMLTEITLTMGLFKLDNQRLIVVYRHPERSQGFGFITYTTDGTPEAEANHMAFRFIMAQDGYAYRTYQPDPRDNGEVPNPYIVKYKYRLD